MQPISINRRSRRAYPSAFLRQHSESTAQPKGKQRLYTYERDIICLPAFFCSKDNLIKIPRKKFDRHFLAVNKLVGKIQLNNGMSEFDIFQEVRSVVRTPMGDNEDFRFQILQSSGGDSRSLMVPELSASYKWGASAVAGKNAKTPIYILARDNLKVIYIAACNGWNRLNKLPIGLKSGPLFKV